MPNHEGVKLILNTIPGAHVLWTVPIGNSRGEGSITSIGINGRVVIVHEYPQGDGWAAYIDPFPPTVAETLDAIRAHCRGLEIDTQP